MSFRQIAVLLFGAPLFGQTVVEVRGTSQIFLAGLNAGSFVRNDIGSDTAPQNSPVTVDFPLRPGQALRIAATGSVKLFGGSAQAGSVGPSGSASEMFNGSRDPLCFSGTCIGMLSAQRGALVGIFTGEPNTGGKTYSNYLSAAADAGVVSPLTWQPFLVGEGKTPAGEPRNFVVPAGATRFYLGVLGIPVSGNSGSFTVTVAAAPSLPPVGSVNPILVLGHMTPLLAGMKDGGYLTTSSFSNLNSPDFAPFNSPALIDVKRLQSRILRFGAVGKVSCSSTAKDIAPDGLIGTYVDSFTGFSPPTGLSEIHAPLGSLVGVFTGDQLDPTLGSFRSDYTTAAARDIPQRAPGLQELFYIGGGRTTKGEYKSFAVPEGATRLYLGVMDQSYRESGAYDNTGSFFVTVVPDTGQEPAISAGGVVNGASYATSPIAAGSFTAIFGNRLAPRADSASTVPLPTTLANARVWVNGIAAPLYSAGPGQINVQIPKAVEGETEAQIVVSNGLAPGLPAIASITNFGAGIFLYGDRKAVIVNAATGGLVTESDPARPGDTLVIYATGLGATTAAPEDGAPASMTALSYVAQPVTVDIGGVAHTPAFSGLAPGFIGVYQINVQVQSSVSAGKQSLRVVSGRSASNSVDIFLTR